MKRLKIDGGKHKEIELKERLDQVFVHEYAYPSLLPSNHHCISVAVIGLEETGVPLWCRLEWNASRLTQAGVGNLQCVFM